MLRTGMAACRKTAAINCARRSISAAEVTRVAESK
jgi:hypothetical protein